jgi:hypothetical protein
LNAEQADKPARSGLHKIFGGDKTTGTDRLDKSLGATSGVGATGTISGSADINVNFKNAPRGTSVGASSSGLFKEPNISKSVQMEPSGTGPKDAAADAE